MSFATNDLDENPYDFDVVATVVGQDALAEAWVEFSYVGPEIGTESQPFDTLAEGAIAVLPGGTVKIRPGTESETLRIEKPMRLEAGVGTVRLGG